MSRDTFKIRLNNTSVKKLISSFIVLFTLSIHAQEIRYSSCNDCWNSDSLGNHRAVVQVSSEQKIVRVLIPWRRRDNDPENKRIIIQDQKTGSKITHVATGKINRESGELFFEPVSGSGIYYVYYMPYKNEGRSNYPKGVYLKPEASDTDWLLKYAGGIPEGKVTEIQSINEFNSFYPMEVIATKQETASMAALNAGAAYRVFPEDRMHSIRMRRDLPQRWILNGSKTILKDTAAKGEYLAFQLGVWALKNIQHVQVRFSDLRSGNSSIPATQISCINTDGTSYDRKPVKFIVDVPAEEIQPMWCGVDIPENAVAGTYRGTATISAEGQAETSIDLVITITDRVLHDGGSSMPEKQTRLKWLNSTLAQDNTVIAPYTPLKVTGHTIALLGRKLVLGENGLPLQIQTFFTPEMTTFSTTPKNILQQPIEFIAQKSGGELLQWKNGKVTFSQQTPGTVQWKSDAATQELKMEVQGRLEFDGYMQYTIKVYALQDVQLADLALKIPYAKASAKYMMGLGQKGGYRPEAFEWKWDVAHKNQDGAWIGDVNAGLQYSLRDEKYVRPLNTNFYLQKPLLLPSSWGNKGKGGIAISEKENTVWVNNYSGERTMKKGDTLYYNLVFLITPFHPINTDFQWQTRFYHKYDNLDTIKATGATVVNIHHATPINPWINYPFIEHKKMKDYIDEAHSKGLKVKIYNTVRELSNHAYETFALRSLGHEVYSPGKGGGFSWLQEHIDSDYIAAWFVPEIKDAALVNSGMSRWHNYYVEGMNWLVKNVGIDGIYLDDVAFDRITMKRIKRVLTQEGHPGIIDLHSANQFNKNDGFNNSANLYMEHFPYLNRLWFGEYFDYEHNTPDFFLTEVSGIPFGLMGEMLQGGGNPWRGMVYGMTNRMPWSDNADPRPIWKAWDDFGMKGTEMIGYWSGNCPVKTGNSQVMATVYRKKGKAMIALASWADQAVSVQLQIDWKKLGIDPKKAKIKAPAIQNFQEGRQWNVVDDKTESIEVAPGKGWMIVISE